MTDQTMTGYLPIAEHGVIGDLHTVALVGTDGTIDWYCAPHFDSPSVFGSILDADRGGYFRISPTVDCSSPKQLYFPDTNVLITRFLTDEGVGEIQDFMPISGGEERHRHRLVRRVVCVRGGMPFGIECEPRFDYARGDHETTRHEHGVVFRSQRLGLALECPVELELTAQGARADFTGRDLSAVNFSGRTLTGAVFTDCRLRAARFDRCRMSLAILTRADATGASFTGADLKGADLSDAILRRVDFHDADLQVQIVTLPDGTTREWPVRAGNAKFNEADFTGAEVTGMLSPGADFAGAKAAKPAGKPKG